MAVRFGVMTDLHGDFMPDAEKRLMEFLKAMEREKVDFIIQLGDFSLLKEKGAHLIRLFNSYSGDGYHVIGNHDTDDCSKEEAIELLGLKRSYYSFEYDDYRFIVLDTNIPNDVGVEFRLTSVQIEWLKKQLLSDDKKVILFSHGSLLNSRMGIKNKEEVHQMMDEVNEQVGYRKVIASVNGHHHFSSVHEREGVYYIDIPSISNQWLMKPYINTAIPEELLKDYQELQHVVPYTEPLYTIVEVDEEHIRIKGKESEYQGAAPDTYGHPMSIGDDELSPVLEEKVLSLQ
ncbi:metallophosphoesterase family protein [Vallitalea okinawensis]|uniref:metallophosphoesterase family protein n=1 Tax=Vallitalea okinawensis TaxID=2078660 RepID=UPI000CFD11AD|nr:metallophosphoesterase [Vallitalea okinawensis]